MSREVNALGLTRETFVLAGIEREEQLKLARETGFVLGQGRALKKPYFPAAGIAGPQVVRVPVRLSSASRPSSPRREFAPRSSLNLTT